MDWYKRSPSAYRARTWDLSLAAHGAYNLLLDHYYLTERPLPLSDQALASICGVAIDAWLEVKETVTRYFTVTNAGLRHDKCDEVIDAAMSHRANLTKRQQEFRKRLKDNKNVTDDSGVTRDKRVSNAQRGDERRLEEKRIESVASVSPPPPPQSGLAGKRGNRLDPEFFPLPYLMPQAKAIGIDYEKMLEDFIDYWVARPGEGGVKLDWQRTWNRWVRTEIGKKGNGHDTRTNHR